MLWKTTNPKDEIIGFQGCIRKLFCYSIIITKKRMKLHSNTLTGSSKKLNLIPKLTEVFLNSFRLSIEMWVLKYVFNKILIKHVL